MHDYELMFALQPEVNEEGQNAFVDKTTQLIGVRGGEVVKVNPWGRRRLAYMIGKYRDGVYTVVNFRLDPAQLPDIEHTFKVNEDILRYIIVRTDA